MRAALRNGALLDPMHVVLFGAVVALSILTGAATAGRAPLMPVVGVLAIAGAAVLFSLTPNVLFLAWFVVAPLLQESASNSAVGHYLGLALYVAPSLIFATWTLTRRPDWRRPRFLDILPLAFLLDVFASLMLVGVPSSNSVKGVYTSMGIGIVLYYFFAVGPIGPLSWESIASVLLVVTVAEGAMGIVDGLTGWNLWHDTGWQGSEFGQSRAIATLANPAVLGTLLGMGIVVSLAILVWNGPARLRTLAIVTLVIGFPALYFTLTRGPIIGTVIGVILVLLSRTKTRLLAVASIVVAVVVLIASWSRITASTVYRQRVTNAGDVHVRLLLQHQSLKLAEEKPLFGWGYNNFDRAKDSAGFTAVSVEKYGAAVTSHNTYLTVLVNQGIIGLLLLLIPWVVIPWRAFKDIAGRPDLRWFTVGALVALVVYVVANYGGDYKYFSFVPAIPWVLLGLLRRRQLAES